MPSTKSKENILYREEFSPLCTIVAKFPLEGRAKMKILLNLRRVASNLTTLLIGYYDYLGTRTKNSHRPTIVPGRKDIWELGF